MKAVSHLTKILDSTDKIPYFYEMPRQTIQLLFGENCNTIDNDKTCKTDGIETIFHNRIKSRLYEKGQNKNTTLQCTERLNITFQILKGTIASLKDNESMGKQALWLAPAPPARTPNYHINDAIGYFKQASSTKNSVHPMSARKTGIKSFLIKVMHFRLFAPGHYQADKLKPWGQISIKCESKYQKFF